MMRRLFAAALASAIALPLAANAADYDPPIVVDDAPEYVPVEVGSGWYLRGDIGYNFKARHSTDTYTLTVAGQEVTENNQFRDKVSLGGGIGYHFTDYLRADVTADRVFGSTFTTRALIAPQGPCIGYGEVLDAGGNTVINTNYPINNCLSEDSASYNAWLVMANAYVDLGTYAGFTPYVGGGAGLARVAWSEATNSITCVPEAANVHFEGCSATGSLNQPDPNTIYTEPGVQNSGVDYRFAWSLGGGVSYALTQALSLDTSYRYTSVSGSNKAIVYNNTPGSSLAQDGFAIHQVRVGLRYDLW